MKSELTKLFKSEDWLSVWIGFAVISLGIIASLTGLFDFSALKFSTWSCGEQLSEAAAAKVVPLGAQFASGAFWAKTARAFLVIGVLFSIGVKLMGESLKKFIPAYIAIFALAFLVRLISAEFTLNRYMEWAFWALVIGLLISNTIGTPDWLRPAIRTEFFIKTGLVIMGFSVLFVSKTN